MVLICSKLHSPASRSAWRAAAAAAPELTASRSELAGAMHHHQRDKAPRTPRLPQLWAPGRKLAPCGEEPWVSSLVPVLAQRDQWFHLGYMYVAGLPEQEVAAWPAVVQRHLGPVLVGARALGCPLKQPHKRTPPPVFLLRTVLQASLSPLPARGLINLPVYLLLLIARLSGCSELPVCIDRSEMHHLPGDPSSSAGPRHPSPLADECLPWVLGESCKLHVTS